MKNVNLVELLQTLSLKGVNLWYDGNNLRSSGSKNVLTPAIINRLKQHKSEIIQLLNQSPDILNVYPLSYGQKSLWFLWQLAPESGAYNFSFAAYIYSKLDIKVWHQIFQKLRERHPILCSTFPKRGEEPIRWVNQQQKLDFLEIDVSDLNEEALNSKVNEFHNSPFNLETEQVMRVRWFTQSNQKHLMLLTIHHIACDGWSIDLILKELSKIYQSKTSSVETHLLPLQHSYQDYVLWQREMLESAEGEKIWSYWKQKLAGELPILNLPIDKPRPPIQTNKGASYRFKLPEKLSQGLKQLAQKQRATIYMVLLASFQVLLYRYTGQKRILVGSPNSGRSRTEFASIIGYFVNQIVLEGDFSNNQSFEKYLNQVRHTVLEALTYPDYPFALLVEKLQPERDLSCSPIFQTYFAFQQFQGKSEDAHNVVMGTEALIKWGDLELLPLAMPNQEGIFDLMLVMAEENESLVGAFSYNRDLFEEKTITKMVGHFQILLDAIVATPEQAITKLPILTPKELQQILVDWNQTIINYPQDQCIHQLFAVQAEKSPDAVAVVFENQQLTYSQLNTKANQLAHYLQKLGIRPEQRVGICVERSLEMVVGLLAILKAGGAYVPLDHKYPSERLAYMVSDASVSLLLTQASLQGSLPEYQGKVICLDRDKEIIAQQSQDNPQTEVNSQNLAYVIYTSGSTGKPKGVAIEHKSPIALINWAKEVFIKPELAGVLASTSICFDLSIFELFFPLTQGGKVILVENILDLPKLKDSKTVTLVNTVPSAITELLKIQGVPDSVKVVNLAGEALKNQLVQQLYQEENIEKVYNLYGPSEDTTYSTFALVEEGATQEPTIGRPIANTQTYILDENLQPMPVGVAGELYIGGDGLARGYLNQPELTAQRFIPNQFENSTDKSEKSRVYKTGDLARYIEDGRIEYLGRIDNQVKLRGFRIELGEIEVALTSHPQVQQAVVMVREDISGSQVLVGYVVSEDKLLSSAELFSCLQDKLPLYMVPSAFVILEALPLTPNGKIDRKALPAPGEKLARTKEFISPRTPNEEIIANIFADVIGVQPVGIHDNFFRLGGHSLQAIQVSARLEKAFDLKIPLRLVMQFPTVALLNEALDELHKTEDSSSFVDVVMPTLKPNWEQRYQQFPLTETQEAYWVGRDSAFDLGNVATHVYLEIDCDSLDLKLLNQAWQKLINHHDMLRAVVLSQGQQQVIEQVPFYEIKVLDLQGQSEESISTQLLAIRDRMSNEVLPTDQWPLFNLCATRLGEERYRLHLNFEVLMIDGWSIALLGQQWLQIYQNPEIELPLLELSFRDYVLAELAIKKTQQYQNSLNYWMQRLDSIPIAPELPFAKSPAALSKPKFKRRSSRLSPQEWQQLKQIATRYNLTASGVLLTAFTDILTCWSKNPKFTINLTLFNRLPLHPQVNELIGDFTSLTLLEVNNSETASFYSRAQRLQKQLWQDLEHRYVTGVEVQRELRRHRGTYQTMGVVFTSTLGFRSSSDDQWWFKQLGELVYGISQTPQVWLDHQIIEDAGSLIFNWDSVDELFPEGMLDDMFESYCNWLQNLATSELVWEETSLQFSPTEQLTQRFDINQNRVPISQQTLHGLFSQQVELCRRSLAVISHDRSLTYGELNELANKVGHWLRQLGASPNTMVAVVMEKGWEQVVAVLGILMSGAAYLPIDPTLPQERQWYLLEQGEVKLILTQTDLHRQLSWPEEIHCLCVDSEQVEEINANPLDSVSSTSDLAYVIYTSGSTGLPKGVAIDHQGAVNTILDINQRFGVGNDDRILAVSALNFDLSVYDIFGSLAAGATIVMPSPIRTKDPAHWLELMLDYQVTVWNSVPALMQILVEYLSSQLKTTTGKLRLVLLSGDWLPLSLPEQIKNLWEDIKVISLGGATEASIWSIYYPIEKINPDWKSIPYGKPLSNQSFHILNELMEDCPVWVPGQLYIGGVGLAKGYWKNHEKTQASFIEHPVTQERLYKTGDLGRYLPDGNIEFLGREDFQVKINGYRIELGEIETVLIQHPAIKKAVVSTVGEQRTNQKLVGYLVPELVDNSIFEVFNIDTEKSQELWQKLVDAGRKEAQQDSSDVEIQTFSEFWQQMQLLFRKSVYLALRKLGVYHQPGEKYELSELMSRCQIVPRYRRWLLRALRMLVDRSLLREHQNHIFESLKELPDEPLNSQEIRDQANQNLGFSNNEINWVLNSAENLAEILTEKINSAEVYATEETAQQYQTVFAHSHEIMKATIGGVVESLQPGKSINILEVGAGYGSATINLLPLLPPEHTSYVFTDISNFFLQKAKNDLADYPFMSYGLLDLDHSPMKQGYEGNSFDIIIGASVLHDARHLKQAIQYLRSLLKPGGLMLLLEETKFYPSFDLGMGLQQGFDRFEDEDLRLDHPLLSRTEWQQILADSGFESTVVLNHPGTISDLLGFDVLVAQCPSNIKVFQQDRLRHYLQKKLPEYMVPHTYVILDELPLTTNGKVDRKALPVPDIVGFMQEREKVIVAPSTSTEVQLSQIWETILEVNQISIDDDFFEVGGDSLLATRIVTQIRESFQVDINLRDFLEAATIKNVAEYLEVTLQAKQTLQNTKIGTKRRVEI